MTDVRLALRQIVYEQRIYWRNPASAFFTFGFPVLLLVIFASLNRGARIAGTSYNQYFVPGMVAFAVMSACYTNVGITLCFRRDLGALKRLRGTPLPLGIFMVGQIGSALVVSTLLVVLTVVVGVLFYGVALPARPGAAALTLLIGAFSFAALGVAVTGVIRHASAAPVVTNGTLFPLVFISGTFVPLDRGSLLARLADLFPVRHFQQAVVRLFDPRTAHAPVLADVLVVVLWGAAALTVAAWTFRWEPRPK